MNGRLIPTTHTATLFGTPAFGALTKTAPDARPFFTESKCLDGADSRAGQPAISNLEHENCCAQFGAEPVTLAGHLAPAGLPVSM